MKTVYKVNVNQNQADQYTKLKNDDDVTLLFSRPLIQTILDHERGPIVYLSPNIDYVNSSRLFRLVYKYKAHNQLVSSVFK